MTYLEDHPPARSQYRQPRRARLTGAIVLHDAENATDLDGADTGAEAVARFISTRTDAAGSYHTVVDRDSIVRLVPYDWEAFGEGTGGNPWALHLSLAYGSKRMPTEVWWAGAIRNAVIEARAMAAHVKNATGITIPARRITAAEYRAGSPGFIPHADLDPRRRTDPVGFPWDPFLSLYANGDATMPAENPYPAATHEALDLLAEHAGYVGDRKWFGPLALEALHRLKNRAELLASADAALRDRLAAAEANREACEAEAAALRAELQTGGRIGQLLADLDAAIAKARA